MLSIVLSKTPFLNQLNSLKRFVKESNFGSSAALPELPFLKGFIKVSNLNFNDQVLLALLLSLRNYVYNAFNRNVCYGNLV